MDRFSFCNESTEDISKIIKKLKWVEARSMKNIPHEYTVRSEKYEKEYIMLYNYIATHFYIEYFYKKPFKYCDIGKYKYWFMSDDISQSKIINRCKKERKYERFN